MSQDAQSPAAAAPFPRSTANASGLDAISYRIGDFLAFRERLRRPLPGEIALNAWRPKPDGDLALQMVDWWAYVADVLTFYNERIANENYLRTAQWPESVAHLVQTVGYRPRPALGAKGVVAGLLSSGARPPIVAPQGLQIQSKAGPGKSPQVFEVDADAAVGWPDVVVADVLPQGGPLIGADVAGNAILWIVGKVSGVKAGDRLLLIQAKAVSAQSFSAFAWIKIVSLAQKSDPLGAPVTEMTFSAVAQAGMSGALAADFILLKARQSTPLWPFGGAGQSPVPSAVVALAGLARGAGVGALALIDVADKAPTPTGTFDWSTVTGAPAPDLTSIDAALSFDNLFLLARGTDFASPSATQTASASSISLAFNAAFSASAQQAQLLDVGAVQEAASRLPPPPLGPTPVIISDYSEVASAADADKKVTILHSVLTYPALAGVSLPAASAVTIRWDWLPVGVLAPIRTAADYALSGSGTLIEDSSTKAHFPVSAGVSILEDGAGVGLQVSLQPGVPGQAAVTTASDSASSATLSSPLEAFFNLIPLSRGKTVVGEVLGSGDTRISGQDFTLAKSPVTYFTDGASVSGDNFSSTVRVSVDGVQWQEAQNFYGLGATAQIFVLREDDNGRTHVTFGDGVNGARLPTGVDNVIAAYRFGAGAEAPAPETLTTVLTPVPGLKGVRNPLPPTGGADPDPPARLRALAPASVLTLGRCVSLDDFAVTAAGAGGVTQAAASFDIDPVSQLPKTTLYVAGDAGAVAAAVAALSSSGATMANVRVLAAQPVTAKLAVAYLRDPRYADADVFSRLTAALLDPDAGLLGANVLGIGQPIYDSQIAAACLNMAGIAAVTGIAFTSPSATRWRPRIAETAIWTALGRVRLPPAPAVKTPRHDPGVGGYFVVPNDADHVTLSGSVAS